MVRFSSALTVCPSMCMFAQFGWHCGIAMAFIAAVASAVERFGHAIQDGMPGVALAFPRILFADVFIFIKCVMSITNHIAIVRGCRTILKRQVRDAALSVVEETGAAFGKANNTHLKTIIRRLAITQIAEDEWEYIDNAVADSLKRRGSNRIPTHSNAFQRVPTAFQPHSNRIPTHSNAFQPHSNRVPTHSNAFQPHSNAFQPI
jgi:hypothetical protein